MMVNHTILYRSMANISDRACFVVLVDGNVNSTDVHTGAQNAVYFSGSTIMKSIFHGSVRQLLPVFSLSTTADLTFFLQSNGAEKSIEETYGTSCLFERTAC